MEFTRQSLRAPTDALVQAVAALSAAADECSNHGATRLGSQLQELADATRESLELLRKEERRLAYRAGALPFAGPRMPAD